MKHVPRPFLQRRWLRPQDCDLLISTIRHGDISLWLVNSKPGQDANLNQLTGFFCHENVGVAWAIAVREYIDIWNPQYRFMSEVELLGQSAGCTLRHKVDAAILCNTFKRKDITAEILDCIYPPETTRNRFEDMNERIKEEIAHGAYTSWNKDVIKWAIGRGFVPTHEHLQELKDL